MRAPRIAATAAGVTLAGLLAACGSNAPTAGFTPITSSGAAAPAPAGSVLQMPGNPVQAPAQVVPAGSAPVAAPRVAPAAQAPTDYSALARQFVTLRNQGTQALATVKGQASSSDLNADKQLMTFAANVYASYVQGLRALPFPAAMKNDVTGLVTVLSSEQGTFVQASQVTTFDQLNPLLQTLVNDQDDQLNATDVLEKDLGLPMSTPHA
ncbi:MAG: hypothetical protein E6J03_06475 [Chloroflexi bacterium]|nr:MAG: hypothetical protein E6J03_06475 [Chloroflexota bacterium]